MTFLPLRGLMLLTLLGCTMSVSLPGCSQTTLTLGPEVQRTLVTPFGINLSGQNYYDSGQMARNLVFRNPGFEGESWQSILHCQTVSGNTCTDVNPYTVWPANFLQNATVETASGALGTVVSSTAANQTVGVTVTLAGLPSAPKAGDFLLVRIDKPGTPEAGWWTSLSGGATLLPEYVDLSLNTTGKQALRINALASGASASVNSYFDTLANHSFVQLRVPYQLHFRAKPIAGNASLNLSLTRIGSTGNLTSFLGQTVPLKPGWNDYTFTTSAVDIGNPIGPVALSFSVAGSTILLDDVALKPYNITASNPTSFRDEVVDALRALHPGTLRYMDNGASFGSSLDNLLASPLARKRSGYSTQQSLQEDIPLGLGDFLMLCATVGADPWITLPPGFTTADSARLIQYLGGSAFTPYGAIRSASGQEQPWTTVFKTIHLELGNEQWNNRSFSGGTWNDPVVYGTRAALIFKTMRSSPFFQSSRFDLVMGSWSAVPWWTGQQLTAANGAADTVAIAPYLFSEFDDAGTTEKIFGPMFAQPQQWDSASTGQVAQQLAAAHGAAAPAKLAVYEVNLGTALGSVPQSAIDSTVPSLGGALAVAEHMLLMLRDDGITTQSMFSLPEFANSFAGGKSTPLWGAVVDMGGSTNLRRPSYLALQMINQAILPNLIASHLTNAPTWTQPASNNDSITASTAQTLESFAFSDGLKRSLILLNLSRTAGVPITFAGASAPTGQVTQTVLTSTNITDNNETTGQVKAVTSTVSSYPVSTTLPAYSMTVLTWNAVSTQKSSTPKSPVQVSGTQARLSPPLIVAPSR